MLLHSVLNSARLWRGHGLGPRLGHGERGRGRWRRIFSIGMEGEEGSDREAVWRGRHGDAGVWRARCCEIIVIPPVACSTSELEGRKFYRYWLVEGVVFA